MIVFGRMERSSVLNGRVKFEFVHPLIITQMKGILYKNIIYK